MIYLFIILSIFVCLFLIYIGILIKPHKSNMDIIPLLHPYAHRGFHSADIPENSLKAFSLACEKGYGIELDVQLSKDGKVMVFHDYTLTRMTGNNSKLSDLTCDELQNISLSNSNEKIPTLQEVLTLVNGKVPLLVELKGENFDTSLCKAVSDILADYNGLYCIESFNPLLIKEIRKHLPNAFIGQLYTNVCRDKNKVSLLNIILTLMAFNFLAKPDFISYNQLDRNTIPVILSTKLYKAYKFVWTVKTEEQLNDSRKYRECPIFEDIDIN